MALEHIADRVVETDVLVIGGGIGGCPAAAKAAEHGLNVTIVEKAKLERSGSAGQGIDHFGHFPRGITVTELVERWLGPAGFMVGAQGEGRWANPNMVYKVFDNAFWAVDELERLGVPMRWDDGEFYWIQHRVRGILCGLRVHWQNVKPQMAAAVRKRGVNILERTMVIDLLTSNGQVVGATAVNTRTGEFIVVKAKAAILATGLFARCFNPETPLIWKYKFRYHWNPASVSGDGYAIAYRAGAELAYMDINGHGYRMRDDLTCSMGNFHINDGIPARSLTWTGEEISRLGAKRYDELERQGLAPFYNSLENLPDDYHKRMEVAYIDERMVSFKIAEDRGFNPRTHRFEIMPCRPHNFTDVPGIYIDEDFKASLKGLYAIGECGAGLGACECAAIPGLLVGDSIHKFVSEVEEPVVDEAQVESQKRFALGPITVKDGTEPMELESAIRYICERYVAQFKSEGLLREGLRRLGSLKRVFLPKLIAKNPHYLMRALEVRNIMDLAEVHANGALERKETRGSHIRLDYPERDPSRDNMITIQRLENGKPVLELREMPEMKPEYAKEESPKRAIDITYPASFW